MRIVRNAFVMTAVTVLSGATVASAQDPLLRPTPRSATPAARPAPAQTSARLAQHPAAVATTEPAAIYTGTVTAPSGSDFRFNFAQKLYDPLTSVSLSPQWQYAAPKDGIYHVDAHFEVPFINADPNERAPYVACRLFAQVSGFTAAKIFQDNGFDVRCNVSTDVLLGPGDLLWIDVGQASDRARPIIGRFTIHYVGPK